MKWIVLIAQAAFSLHAGTYSLPPTDWQNRGYGFHLEVDPARPLVYVQMDGGVDNDLSVFDYSDPARLSFLGTVKGFGTHVTSMGTNLVSTARNRGLCIWDMSDPLHPKLKAQAPNTENWWNGSSYVSGCLDYDEGTLYQLSWNSLATFRMDDMNRLIPLQQFASLPGSYSYENVLSDAHGVYFATQYAGTYQVCLFQKHNGTLIQLTNITVLSPALEFYGGGGDMALCKNGKFLLLSARGDDRIHVLNVSDPAHPLYLLSPYLLQDTNARIACLVQVDDEHVMLAQEGSGVVQILRISPGGQLSAISDGLELNTPVQKGVCAGHHVFFTGFDIDLTMVDVSDRSHPILINQADPNPNISAVAVDEEYIYEIEQKFNNWGLPRVSQLNTADGKLNAWKVVTAGSYFRSVAAFQGTVVLNNDYSLQIFQRQTNGAHQNLSIVYYKSAISCYDRLLQLNDRYVTIGENVFSLDAKKSLQLIGTLPGQASALLSHYAVCKGENTSILIIDLAKSMAVAHRIDETVFDIRGHGNRAALKKQNSLCVLTAGADGKLAISEFPGYPAEPSYGKWNLSLDDNFLILWNGSEANIYSLPVANSPRRLGTCSIPQNYCHGGWYGFLSRGFFYTADAFAGLMVMRLDAGHSLTGVKKGTDGFLQVEWETVNGRLYQLLSSSNLKDWTPAVTGVRGTGQKMTSSGLMREEPFKFYRVVDVGE